MLEFIVLGQIPGTSFQITFSQVILTAVMVFIARELQGIKQLKGLVHTTQDFIKRVRA